MFLNYFFFQGIWSFRKIFNLDYFEDDYLFFLIFFRVFGLEFWFMIFDIYFDNFIICSEKEVVDYWVVDGWGVKIMVVNVNEVQYLLQSNNRIWFCYGLYKWFLKR